MSAWVERARPENAEEVIALNRTCFSTPWSPASIIKDMTVHDYYIVTEGRHALGYACVWAVPPEAELNDICVYPSARRRGYAQLLLSHALCEAKKQGVTMMSLEVRASNAAAIALYQKNGFVCEGIRRAYYTDDREDALILRRREDQGGTP